MARQTHFKVSATQLRPGVHYSGEILLRGVAIDFNLRLSPAFGDMNPLAFMGNIRPEEIFKASNFVAFARNRENVKLNKEAMHALLRATLSTAHHLYMKTVVAAWAKSGDPRALAEVWKTRRSIVDKPHIQSADPSILELLKGLKKR